MLKRIVIATDGSEHAKKAVAFGSDIASKYGAEVVLVHVLLRDHLSDAMRELAEVEYHADAGAFSKAVSEIPDARFPLAQVLPKDAVSPGQALEAVAGFVLKEAEEIAREHGATNVSRRTEDGNPAARILEVAEAVNADMIVTGARGLSDLKALMVGSVSHRLSNTAPMTCVCVR
ncbi:universal stress protein [Roseibium aggregatum]|uniref:Universal stress protein n=1 Tax=Roseibium aggregatum TaxID=187304 RepID=A0A926P4V3_9HYPH|nr:universal stress protein [Roseibium aggregatum]MBD1549583.1 universal stress protein [Roseibium aggregatum]